MYHYEAYADYYDYVHQYAEDIPFFRECADRTGSPILELACGTGRVLIPLAQAGHTVHGLDSSEEMLSIARQKIERAGLSELTSLTCANMADFDLPVKSFALAFVTARSFMHLFSQQEQIACLSRVIDHLRPGGLFVVDVYSPSLQILASPCDAEFDTGHEYPLPNGHKVVVKKRFTEKDFVNQINQTEMAFEEYDGRGGLVRKRSVAMTTRYSFRFELQLLLEKVGFEIESLFGGFDKRPYDGTGEIIFVARKPGKPPNSMTR